MPNTNPERRLNKHSKPIALGDESRALSFVHEYINYCRRGEDPTHLYKRPSKKLYETEVEPLQNPSKVCEKHPYLNKILAGGVVAAILIGLAFWDETNNRKRSNLF